MASSQGSEMMTDSQADRLLGIDHGDSQADGVMPPPISKEPTPDWLDKKNHPALANPLAGSAVAKPPKPPVPVLQPSGTSVLGAQIRGMQVGEPAAAPAPSDATATATATAKKPAAAAAAKSTADDESTDQESEEEVELSAEEKEKAELVKNINDVIARAKAAGYIFGGKSETAAAAMYLDDKQLFDDEGLDISSCAKGAKKKISLGSVSDLSLIHI